MNKNIEEQKYIESVLEKSNLIMKKFMIMFSNGISKSDVKALKTANELLEHISRYYFECNEKEVINLIENYRTNEEQIVIIDGKDNKGLSFYIADVLEIYNNRGK